MPCSANHNAGAFLAMAVDKLRLAVDVVAAARPYVQVRHLSRF
jgi:hypothetical protein